MARQVTIDHAAIVQMWKRGMSIEGISSDMQCSISTVRRALAEAGYQLTKPQPERKSKLVEEKRIPIYPEEINRYRERLKIGSVVKLPHRDEKSRCPLGGKYTVIAKYPSFFIAVRGKCERHELYVTMIINERERIRV